MSAQTFQPIAPRPAPVRTEGPAAWIRNNLFGNLRTSLGTVAIALVLAVLLPRLLNWAVFDAIWSRDFDACHTAAGACWGVVAEKFRIIIFGRYPFEEQWRPLLSTTALLGMQLASSRPSKAVVESSGRHCSSKG